MDLNELMKNPDQIKSLIDVLQALLPKEQQEPESSEDKAEAFTNSAIKTRSGRKPSKQKASDNKFLSMPERHMHKEDVEVDRVLSKSPPVARSREYEPIKVKCRVCGKEEMINPSLVYDAREGRYKCNKCSSSSG